MIDKIKKYLEDLIMPISCINCGNGEEWLCEKCGKKISFYKAGICVGCGDFSQNFKTCSSCKSNLCLNGAFVLGSYEDEILKKIIWEYKYNFIKDLGDVLSLLWLENFGNFLSKKNSVIVSVPLSSKRLKYRGFNQSEIIAEQISEKTGIVHLKNHLSRIRETQAQKDLSKAERIKNVNGSFYAKEIKAKTVYLVDDVITTGATMSECAKELKDKGAVEVWGVVLAKD